MPDVTTQRVEKALDEIAKESAERVTKKSSGRTLVEFIWVDGKLRKVTITPANVLCNDEH